eukprot:m.184526 g.184526  ORF g.184526 m.184526 type:complete len:102 (+) comp39324_c0_seq10:903-1208(+)
MIDINVNDTPINLIDDVTAQWVESNSDDYDFLSLQDYPEEVRQPEGSQQEIQMFSPNQEIFRKRLGKHLGHPLRSNRLQLKHFTPEVDVKSNVRIDSTSEP